MEIDLDGLSPGRAYHTMIQTVVPRPIAWVLTENAGGGFNLAPFSYFNAVCTDPPLVMISVGKKPDGSAKDTRANIVERDRFVVHVAHEALLEALNESSATLPAEESEVERLGLELTEFDGFELPRLRDARIALACERFRVDELGPLPQALILGRVRRIHVDDALCRVDDRGRMTIDAESLAPIARLGGNDYAIIGHVRRLPRPS